MRGKVIRATLYRWHRPSNNIVRPVSWEASCKWAATWIFLDFFRCGTRVSYCAWVSRWPQLEGSFLFRDHYFSLDSLQSPRSVQAAHLTLKFDFFSLSWLIKPPKDISKSTRLFVCFFLCVIGCQRMQIFSCIWIDHLLFFFLGSIEMNHSSYGIVVDRREYRFTSQNDENSLSR